MISTYVSVCKLNSFGQKFEIWMELPILDGWKMTFWAACSFSPHIK